MALHTSSINIDLKPKIMNISNSKIMFLASLKYFEITEDNV